MATERIRVFLVDDHPLVREWLTNLLREQPDLEVCGQAADARSALAAMRAAPPDVAVVDLSLTSGTGLALIKDLHEQLPAIVIVVLTMHEEVSYAERAFRAGARGYVKKRDSTDQILEAIRQTHQGKVYASQDLLAAMTGRFFGRTAVKTTDPIEQLSDRELEVFRRLGRGEGTRIIADDLGLSIKTVQVYCVRIKEKLDLQSSHELFREAVRWVEKQAAK
ncbi:MAG: response regulator transcription factor [Opitutae bacterium]|nr:response regulator transcription factor [Opitutae bacterium]